MSILYHPLSANSNGGTELMCRRLEKYLPEHLMNEVQIVPSRLQSFDLLDSSKIRILWLHDLPGDPAADFILKNNGWKNFHKIVAVSNWQMQAYISVYQIPWSKFVVISNAIEPVETNDETYDDGKIHCIYTPTPHRGLDVLAQSWDMHNNLTPGFKDKFVLDVYSSFALYGWEEKNEDFLKLYEWLEAQDNIVYHGTKSNEDVREALNKSDLFLYPAIWQETSCLCLMEAMSAGLICVHSNLGALYETSANFTEMYHYHEDKVEHSKLFAQVLGSVIQNMDVLKPRTKTQKQYADSFYNWKLKSKQWEMLITHMLNLPREEVQNPDVMLTFET